MSTERFRRFEADGSGQQMMPLLITDQILVKPVSNPDGLALLLRSTPNAQTGEPVATQWYITPDHASWLAQHLQQALNDANANKHST